ncbi:MAG: aldo/keto reductase [Oscillospiraceae bacterium]|nr:aldo/keto reductase [Oscillospiraceae bacterium]
MEKIRLGKTNLMVSRSGFGAIPIQRIGDEESTALLRAAFEGGINFYDTARGYTTSERKIGLALKSVRKQIIIATKSGAQTGEQLEKDLETSLFELGTDYIDIYQFHNPSFIPQPGEANGLYEAALKAKAAGKIRHIGVTNHRLELALEMAKSGLFETMQFPASSLATEGEIELVNLCGERDVGFVAMKALAGGLITNAKTAFAYLRQFGNVVPIWGLQHMEQLEEFLGYEKKPPVLDGETWQAIESDRERLRGGYCRACGYCLPCPAKINIPMAARMELLLGRMSLDGLVGEHGKEMMNRINDCTECRHCADCCPYRLDTPKLLKSNLAYYEKFIAEKL